MDKVSGGRGGKRVGAGRPAKDNAVIVASVSAYVDQVSLDLIEFYGEGNDSLGIRRICAALIKLQSTAKVKAPAGRVKHKPVYVEPSEFAPDGTRRTFHALLQLKRGARDKYNAELQSYVE